MNKYELALADIKRHFCNYCKKSSCVKCEWHQDLQDLDELVMKYCNHRSYHHPILVPCTCGHNRRNRYTKWEKGVKYYGLECKACGYYIWADSEIGVKHEWNKANAKD